MRLEIVLLQASVSLRGHSATFLTTIPDIVRCRFPCCRLLSAVASASIEKQRMITSPQKESNWNSDIAYAGSMTVSPPLLQKSVLLHTWIHRHSDLPSLPWPMTPNRAPGSGVEPSSQQMKAVSLLLGIADVQRLWPRFCSMLDQH